MDPTTDPGYTVRLSPPHSGHSETQAFPGNHPIATEASITRFESQLGEHLGNHYVAALNSGTAALHLALILLGVGPDDEVLCQSLTFVASANPILYQGATPVFIDSERSTWNLDPDLLQTAIEDRLKKGRRPRACIVVHLYGMPAQMERIRQVCDHYHVPIIEDAAAALGSTHSGRPVGTVGRLGILSFNCNKIITTLGGGALLSADAGAVAQARFLSTQAKDPAPHYQHSMLGYNYRMNPVAASLGSAQLKQLSERIARRRHNFSFYRQHLPLEWQPEHTGCYSNRWLSCALFPSSTERDAVRQHLLLHGVETRPVWKPLHLQPLYANCPRYVNGTAEDLFRRGLCFPSGSDLTSGDLHRIQHLTKQVFNPRPIGQDTRAALSS